MCAARAHGSPGPWGPCLPKSPCSFEAMLIVFRPSLPRIAPFSVADEVLASDTHHQLVLKTLENLSCAHFDRSMNISAGASASVAVASPSGPPAGRQSESFDQSPAEL